MDSTQVIALAREAVMLMLQVSAPVLVIGMLVGLIISIMQADTQVQEQTLSFVPKIVIMLLVSAATAPWAMEMVMQFSRRMFGELP
jgi:flagellar biosynthetic protein FliQ